MQATREQLRTHLMEAGLLSTVEAEAWSERCEQADGESMETAFFVMAVLDSIYGTESDDTRAAARRVADRVLVFNEFHETPREAFFSTVTSLCSALAIDNVAGEDDMADDLPFETVEDLADALNEALTDGLGAFVFGHDTWAMVLIRSAAPTGVLWDELAE